MAPVTLVPTCRPPPPSSLRKLSEQERINLLVRMNNEENSTKTQGGHSPRNTQRNSIPTNNTIAA